jgi:hypothetical protein
MKTLYDELGISTKLILPKKIKYNRISYAIKIQDTQENLIKYFDTVGYRYDYHKIIKSAISIEYLKHKNILFKIHEEKINKLRLMHDTGSTTKQIADTLNMNIDLVRHAIRSYRDNRKISCFHLKENNIDNWYNKIEHKGLSMFIPIESIIEVENQLISDITTESPNHSFIAADHFMVHNSAQCKQAIGIYALNYQDRCDTIGHILNTPQKPLVYTKMSTILNNDHMPNGVNVIVAICTYTGLTLRLSPCYSKSCSKLLIC